MLLLFMLLHLLLLLLVMLLVQVRLLVQCMLLLCMLHPGVSLALKLHQALSNIRWQCSGLQLSWLPC